VNTEKQVIKASAYVVKDGDYLWKIAEEAYGDGMAWSRIAQANKIANPNVIYTGTRLSLPR
ncbi:MAG: LysM peptidoglycan-binding domain-containing protein, partial [Patescibacteria group bacterium]